MTRFNLTILALLTTISVFCKSNFKLIDELMLSGNRGFTNYQEEYKYGGGFGFYKVFFRESDVEFFVGPEYSYTSVYKSVSSTDLGYFSDLFYNIHSVSIPLQLRVNFLKRHLVYSLGPYFDIPLRSGFEAEYGLQYDREPETVFNIKGVENFQLVSYGISTDFGIRFRLLKKEFINTYGLRLTKKHYPDGISFFNNFFYRANLSMVI